MKEYIIALLSDPSFMGALLGAVVTGLIAISIMLVQIKNQRVHNKLIEYKTFYKCLRHYIDDIIDFTDRLTHDIESELKSKDINEIKEYMKNITEHVSFLRVLSEGVKDEAVMHDVYYSYISTKECLYSIELKTEEIIEDIKNGEINEENLEDLKRSIRFLNHYNSNLFDKLEEVEAYLKHK